MVSRGELVEPLPDVQPPKNAARNAWKNCPRHRSLFAPRGLTGRPRAELRKLTGDARAEEVLSGNCLFDVDTQSISHFHRVRSTCPARRRAGRGGPIEPLSRSSTDPVFNVMHTRKTREFRSWPCALRQEHPGEAKSRARARATSGDPVHRRKANLGQFREPASAPASGATAADRFVVTLRTGHCVRTRPSVLGRASGSNWSRLRRLSERAARRSEPRRVHAIGGSCLRLLLQPLEGGSRSSVVAASTPRATIDQVSA